VSGAEFAAPVVVDLLVELDEPPAFACGVEPVGIVNAGLPLVSALTPPPPPHAATPPAIATPTSTATP
jgi:hypothetical protein